MWQHVKLSDISLRTLPRYNPVVDEDVKKPHKQTNKQALRTPPPPPELKPVHCCPFAPCYESRVTYFGATYSGATGSSRRSKLLLKICAGVNFFYRSLEYPSTASCSHNMGPRALHQQAKPDSLTPHSNLAPLPRRLHMVLIVAVMR